MRSAEGRPWLILFVLFIAFVPATAKDWGLTPFGAAVAGFTPMALSPLGGILFGILSDRYGRRSALFSSILLSAASALLSGLSVGPYDFGLYRLAPGVGIRGQWAVSMTLVSEVWPPDERGRAVATVQTSFPAGFIAASAASGSDQAKLLKFKHMCSQNRCFLALNRCFQQQNWGYKKRHPLSIHRHHRLP